MIEEQIEARKTALEEGRVQREIASQKVYSNHQNLEQEKHKNEQYMQEQIKLNENLVSQKNDIAL